MESDNRSVVFPEQSSDLDSTQGRAPIHSSAAIQAQTLFEILSSEQTVLLEYVKYDIMAREGFDISDIRLLLYYALRRLTQVTLGELNETQRWDVLGRWQNVFALMIELGEEASLKHGGGNPLVHVLRESLSKDNDIEPIRRVWREILDPRQRWFAYISLHIAEGLFFEGCVLDWCRNSFSITPR